MGIRTFDFMLPDFDGLRKPSSTIAGCFSSKSTPCEASQCIKNFFLQYFSEKVLLSSNKSSPFCVKSRPSAAKIPPSLSTSLQNAVLQTAASPTPIPALIPEPDVSARFFDLWLAQPSWSPILLTENGWITVKSKGNSKKQVPLTFGILESYYRRGYTIGKRFGQLTRYLMIDIDIHSAFHPDNGGFQPILAVMESLGLCRYLIVRSSDSGGIHLYFPLSQPVNAWQLAATAHNALTASGITIAGGQCELFPNKKSFNAEFNGHRLPLQNGSFLLDQDFCPISNCKADFLDRWEIASAHQDEQMLQLALTGQLAITVPSTPVELPSVPMPQRLGKQTTSTGHVIPPIAWTRFRQSNDIMCELVNYGDRYVGLNNSADLAAWVKAVAPQLPGYEKFASPKSKRDIEQGTWPKRWAESHFRSVWKHKVGGSDHNANVARDARTRIFAALDRMCVNASIGITCLFNTIISISESCFDKSISWHTLKKYQDEILAYIKRPGILGLSSGHKEDINSSSPELPSDQIIEPEYWVKNCYTQLLTLRCAVRIYSDTFALLHTSKNGTEAEGQAAAKTETELLAEVATAEITETEMDNQASEPVAKDEKGHPRTAFVQKGLSAGQRVRIVMPGGSLDGIETRVLAQTVDVLGQPVYQLEHQRQGQAISLPAECLQIVTASEPEPPPKEAVIRATAAQLLQVLGQACPFVGPGLWTVRRDEVTPKAWVQLEKLIGAV